MQNLAEIIVVSIALVLLLGEAVVILNVYKASNPVKYLFRKGKDIIREMSYEEKNFLLRDLELHKEIAERRERKIENGVITGSVNECREREYLLQSLIDRIKTVPTNSVNERETFPLFKSF